MSEYNDYCEYRKGYFKALLDILHFYENYSTNLKINKMYNPKSTISILNAIIQNRELFMKWGGGNITFGCDVTVDPKTKTMTIKEKR